MTGQLSDYEKSILRSIPFSGVLLNRAFAAWFNDQEGRVEMGPVRLAQFDAEGTLYECSPFPGAWTTVREDRILSVRHIDALR